MVVFFVRHGEAEWGPRDPGLTEHGVAMAEAAAAWLRRNAWRPIRLVTTSARRTRETAETLQAYGWPEGFTPEILVVPGAVRTLEQWEDLCLLLGDGGALVGQHPTQGFLQRAFGAPALPKENRAAV